MNKIKIRHIISLISLVLFLIITFLVISGNISTLDNSIYNLVYELRNYEFIDTFLKLVTRLGNVLPTIIIVLILLIILKKEYKIILLGTESITIIINQVLKHLFRRPRPPVVERLIKESGFSYPSGHSMMALCLYGTLIYIIYKEIKNKKLKVILITLLSIFILLIGLSRIYVRVHYPSDVLGGFTLTIPILITIISLIYNHFRGDNND